MFGLSYQEVIVVLAVVLLVFGPKRLPELARGLARLMNIVRTATADLRRSLLVDFDTPPPPRPRNVTPHPQPVDETEPGTVGAYEDLYPPPAPSAGDDADAGADRDRETTENSGDDAESTPRHHGTD